MTINEFAISIHRKLESATSRTDVNRILGEAKSVLQQSDISSFDVRTFWVELHSRFRHVREVNYGATHDLMAYAIEQVRRESIEASK